MNYYPEPDSYMRDKVKVVLNLSNSATKRELDHATAVLAAKKRFHFFESRSWQTRHYETSECSN